jgi:hypothetical protein
LLISSSIHFSLYVISTIAYTQILNITMNTNDNEEKVPVLGQDLFYDWSDYTLHMMDKLAISRVIEDEPFPPGHQMPKVEGAEDDHAALTAPPSASDHRFVKKEAGVWVDFAVPALGAPPSPDPDGSTGGVGVPQEVQEVCR